MTAGMQDSDETYVFQVSDHLYSSKDRDRLHRELLEKIKAGGLKRVIMDFSRARWFGAPILGELVVAAQLLHERGGELLLVGSPKIDRMIKAARVDRVKLFANVQSALASLGRPACAAA